MGEAHLLVQGLLPRDVGLLRGLQGCVLAGEGGHEVLQGMTGPPTVRKSPVTRQMGAF